MLVTVYCSGSIQKGPSDNGKKLYWTDVERHSLTEAAHPLNVRFLNPDDTAEDLSDTLALFGRDMYQVQYADFVVVDARERRGIGIGIEMVASKVFGTPLIVVSPIDTHYRKSKVDYRGSSVNDYIHPHLYGLADAVVDNFAAAGAWMKHYIEHPTKPKGNDVLFKAIDEYKTRMLPNDPPMLEILREMEVVDRERQKK
jgi:hypothetical protein